MKVGLVLAGYGPWGVNHARTAAAAANARLVGIVEPSPERRAQAGRDHDVATYPDLDTAMQDPAAQAVIVATPAPTHALVASQALDAGRHVLVEKPAAMRVADAGMLIDLAARKGLQLAAGHTFLYSQPINNIRRWIMDNSASRPWLIRSERLGGRRRHDCDVIWNLAPHDISILLHVTGEPVVEVAARGVVFPRGQMWDSVFIQLRFASGVIGEVSVGWRHPGTKRALRVLGEDWALRYRYRTEGDAMELVGTERNAALLTQGCDVSADGRIVGYPEPLLGEVESFAEACLGGRSPASGTTHLYHVVEVLEAAADSAASAGAPIMIDSLRSPNMSPAVPVLAS